MANTPEIRRKPLYFHAPPLEEMKTNLGEDRYWFVLGTLIQMAFSDPSFSFQRLFYANIIHEMYHEPWEARKAGYDDLEILYSIALMQGWSSDFGLLTGKEIEQIHQGKRVETIDQEPKYKTWEELTGLAQKWKIEGKVVGLAHGAFDPPHIGHSHLFTAGWPYCDVLVVGFDPNWSLTQRKGADRPRFPTDC